MPSLRIVPLLFALLLPASALADTITLRADQWCPYNCEPGSRDPGYMIEIAKRVFEPAGHKVDYALMPYDAAIGKARDGEIVAVVGAARADAPDLLFPAQPMGNSTYVFAVARDIAFQYQGSASLAKVKLGAVEDYTYDPGIDTHIAANKGRSVTLVSGDDAVGQLLLLLAERKLDVVIDDEAVLIHSIDRMGLGNLFELQNASDGSPVYIAFSPKLEKAGEYAALLDRGVDKLRRTGELTAILKKYGLKDWAQ